MMTEEGGGRPRGKERPWSELGRTREPWRAGGGERESGETTGG